LENGAVSEFRGYVGCYVWDLLDEGIERVLDRLAGEVGAQGISLSVAVADVVVLRSNLQMRPRLLRVESGVFFQPDASRYRGTRLRPVVSRAIRKSNPLPKIIAAAQERGLSVRVRVAGTNGRTLVIRHPHAACRNVFDDPWPDRLCPSNPDVRGYLCGLVDDLGSNYAIEAVELADFGFPYAIAGGGAVQVGRPLDDQAMRWLLTCCCPSCRQAATRTGLNVETYESTLRASVDAHLEQGAGPQPENVEAFDRWRASELASLIHAIQSAASKPVIVALALRPPAFVNPQDIISLTEAAQTVQWMIYAPRQRPEQGVPEPGGGNVEFAFPAYPPYFDDPEALVRFTAGLVGCRAVCFQQYGVFPEPVLDWIRRAIRYARREAGPA
jgi:hypothetical protein